ncbi:MAG: carboxypeptidase regulatory-like domain-containing protein [Acidimicrobiia bacterium]|nr:carboxypeptidase regulatory-like domain-containing protein [Acidimicrobiia bacterium]
MNRTLSVGPREEFVINGILPGAYTLYAMVRDQGVTYSARENIDVGSENIDGLMVRLTAGGEVAGEMIAEEREKLPSSVRVSLSPSLAGGFFLGTQQAEVKEGRFALANVQPERYRVNVTGLPDGYFVKTVRAGDQDAMENGFEPSVGTLLRITVSGKAGLIDGTVTDGSEKLAAGSTVALLDADPKRRGRFEHSRIAVTDQNGVFGFMNVPPGGYKLFAWQDIEPGAWMDPDFAKAFESKAEAITLRESGRESVSLKVLEK